MSSFDESPRQNLGGNNNNNNSNLPIGTQNSSSNLNSKLNNINHSEVKPGSGFGRFRTDVINSSQLEQKELNSIENDQNAGELNNNNNNSSNSNNNENLNRASSGFGPFHLSNANRFGFNSLGNNFNYNNARGTGFDGFNMFSPYNDNTS